jgi:hypothetical protein
LTPDLTRGRKNERELGFPNRAEKKQALRFQDLAAKQKMNLTGALHSGWSKNRAMREQETNKNSSAKNSRAKKKSLGYC